MSDEDTSFTNSSVENIDVDTIDISESRKKVKKTRTDVLAIKGASEVPLPESESSGNEEEETRRKESPVVKYKNLVEKYTKQVKLEN